MKLSDTDLAAVEHSLHVSMAMTPLRNWPDGLLLQLLQLDQLTKLNEQVVGLKKAHLGAIAKMADLLEVIEKLLPTAPYVPDEEAAEAEAAEAEAAGVEAGPVTTSREPTKWPLGASARDVGNRTQESLRKEAYPEQSNVTVIDPDHYA